MLRDEREERREGAELGGEGSEWGTKGGKEGKQKVLGTGSSARNFLATHSNSFLQSLLSFSIGEEQKKRNARRRLHEML